VSTIGAYPITIDLHTQNDCYKAARARKKTHIFVHSTAVKGPQYDPRWKQWNRPDFKKCASAWIDSAGIYQTLPWTYQAWLNGVTAGNDCGIAFEICEPSADTPENAADLYGKTLYLCHALCEEFLIRPSNVLCHAEAYMVGLANNHTDVTHWWGERGTPWERYTMDTLRADLAAALSIKDEYPFDALVVTQSSPLNIWRDVRKTRSLAKVPSGEALTVTGTDISGWFRVEKDGIAGVADGQYLRRIERDAADEAGGTGTGAAMAETPAARRRRSHRP